MVNAGKAIAQVTRSRIEDGTFEATIIEAKGGYEKASKNFRRFAKEEIERTTRPLRKLGFDKAERDGIYAIERSINKSQQQEQALLTLMSTEQAGSSSTTRQ
jgi:hypothetical protein